MQIFDDASKKSLLEALDGIRRGIPLMDMDDRDFTASLLYRMAEIVREHGPSHGVNLNPYARYVYSGGRSGGKMYEQSFWAAVRESVERKKAVSEFKINEGDIAKVIYNPPATVIYWKDGTKTVVKCSDHDLDEGRLSPETGLVYAITKKVLGNTGNYNDVLRRLVNRAKKS